jgi:predicted GNAT family acetyltransferase
MSNPLRWRRMKKNECTTVESLLRFHERWCMNACNRYLHNRNRNVWVLHNKSGEITALIIHFNQNLMPVLCGQNNIPLPHFLRGLFGTIPIHSLQGRKEDALILETVLEKTGLSAAEKIDYDLMCIDNPPSCYETSGPAGLIIRQPQFTDMSALTALQAAYEQEEVLPAAAEFNAAVSRLNTERIFAQEQMLVAELDGRLVGKINTNAVTFTRYQAGGVYVLPDYRGRGIARRMAGVFISSLIAQGRGISLFVKKSNHAARRVYQRIGFEILGDYRISYF